MFSGETGFSGDGKNEILHACASSRNKIIRQEATTWPSHVFWWRNEVSNSFSHVDRPTQHIYANNDRHSASRAAVKYVRLIVACLLALRIATEYNSFGRALKYARFGEILEDPLFLRLILETDFLWGTTIALTASLDRGGAKVCVPKIGSRERPPGPILTKWLIATTRRFFKSSGDTAQNIPVTHGFFFRETEKSFREISGKGPDEKNYCIIGFPGVRGKFPGNFPRVSGKFPGSRNSSPTGPPPGLRGLTHRREFRCTGTRSMQPITGAFGIGGQGRGLRRSGLRIILPLEFQGLPCLRPSCGLSRRVRSPILLAR